MTIKKIALVNQKGGGGKTTTAYSLAVAAEKAGFPSTIIDLDPHGNAVAWSDDRKEYWEDRPEASVPIVEDSIPARLSEKIKKAEKDGSQYIFIDTPASLAEPSMAAVKNADLIIIPLKPRKHDLNAFGNNLNLLRVAVEKPVPAFAFLNECPPQGIRHIEAAREIQKNYNFPVCSLHFCKREAYADASIVGLTAQEYEPNGKAAQEISAFFNFVNQLLLRLESEDYHEAPKFNQLFA